MNGTITTGARRKMLHADCPGAYGLVLKLQNSVLDPGDPVLLEIYISGYGQIESTKLVIYPSVTAFDPEQSDYQMGAKLEDGLVTFGNQVCPLDPSGTGNTMTLAEDLFMDVPDSPLMILTEKRLGGSAPVQLNFHLLKKARPGSHAIAMRLTYFNGNAWASSDGLATVKVRNLFERHEGTVWVLGFAVAVLGIVIGVQTILHWFV